MQQSAGWDSSETPQVESEPSVPEPQDVSAMDTRSLLRLIRRPSQGEFMPESEMWRAYLELSRRGEPQVTELFLRSLKGLHRRRAVGAAELPCSDPNPDEHRLVEDPYVGELWKAYKRCISQRRPGPAGALLRDLEQQLVR